MERNLRGRRKKDKQKGRRELGESNDQYGGTLRKELNSRMRNKEKRMW